MTKLPNVTDEPDDRKHVWNTVHEQAGVRLLYVDRQLIWNLIAQQLATDIREHADSADVPGSPATPDVIRGIREAADLIAPDAPTKGSQP